MLYDVYEKHLFISSALALSLFGKNTRVTANGQEIKCWKQDNLNFIFSLIKDKRKFKFRFKFILNKPILRNLI